MEIWDWGRSFRNFGTGGSQFSPLTCPGISQSDPGANPRKKSPGKVGNSRKSQNSGRLQVLFPPLIPRDFPALPIPKNPRNCFDPISLWSRKFLEFPSGNPRGKSPKPPKSREFSSLFPKKTPKLWNFRGGKNSGMVFPLDFFPWNGNSGK